MVKREPRRRTQNHIENDNRTHIETCRESHLRLLTVYIFRFI